MGEIFFLVAILFKDLYPLYMDLVKSAGSTKKGW